MDLQNSLRNLGRQVVKQHIRGVEGGESEWIKINYKHVWNYQTEFKKKWIERSFLESEYRSTGRNKTYLFCLNNGKNHFIT